MPSCLSILKYPDKRLLTATNAVTFPLSLDDLALVADLTETLYAQKACGLGANQVGSDKSIFILDLKACGEKRSDLSADLGIFINPRIVQYSRDKDKGQEACLSLPGLQYTISRSVSIELEAFDAIGDKFCAALTGFVARAAQHEFDHLQGVLFIDRMGETGKKMALKRLMRHA